ncbi:undecaprenyldiphospho-muramoylpentapeptide beta-N-acetylglucosaminyltransferase [Helicobacter anatolicus]|uniref:undecaprenyldiphospho-muramoylpentapeptide beta-N-acetylglucosaminyltransferase n=1 Tax=Helicobacter anatolicus TaxID=2905874 RepID=UPI001E2EDD25|nr:undecaprenyldiphospho-muramoylpentapeptide beta-N-acetylglucosaminyltransferase [Helicobacter anatolicus]MCE3039805.1 undecaprenyldiphospho-muramoylpentapeptide beta-N-acetylglucosaminyltransferase [Helicobacter anatolicus]
MYVITGGGTGGHLAIAKVLATVLKKQKQPVIYIGSLQGQDRVWFEKNDLFDSVYFLNTTGVVDKKGAFFIKAIVLQIRAILKVRAIFKTHKIHTVISVGGFSAGPASIAAILSGKRFFIHEQNAIKGKLNQMLTPFAKNIFGSFEDKSKQFLKTPYPVRQEFFLESRVRKKVRTILFLGGSQGAVAINEFALNVAQDLILRGYKIIHQCGSRDFERMKQEYIRMELFGKIDLFDFSSNIITKISAADLCICRAGASSVWELAANGLPCIYVPYPYAAGNHQYYNALFFENKKLGFIVEQHNLTQKKVFGLLDEMEVDLENISRGLQNSIQKNGAEIIIKKIMEK